MFEKMLQRNAETTTEKRTISSFHQNAWSLGVVRIEDCGLRGQVESRRLGRLRLHMIMSFTHMAKLKAN